MSMMRAKHSAGRCFDEGKAQLSERRARLALVLADTNVRVRGSGRAYDSKLGCARSVMFSKVVTSGQEVRREKSDLDDKMARFDVS